MDSVVDLHEASGRVTGWWQRRSWRWVAIAVTFAALAYGGVAEADPKTDEPFSRWLEARERLVCDAVAMAQNFSEDDCYFAAIAVKGYSPAEVERYSSRRDLLDVFISEGQQREDPNQFEEDKAEAAERGISIEAVLKERLITEAWQRRREAEAQREKEQVAEEMRETAIVLATVAAPILFFFLLFKSRHWIAGRWRRNKALRTWVFASICWPIGVFLFVFFVRPYGSTMSDMEGSDFEHMLGVMIILPLFFVAVWFGYKRFVE